MTLHLTKKNWFVWVSGVCVVLLAAIAVLVPSDHWGLPPWRWVIVALVGLAFVGLTVQLFVQSREDNERDAKELKRDQSQQGIETKLTALMQLVSTEGEQTTSLEAVKNKAMEPLQPPVNFDAKEFFRLAYHSDWTLDVEKRIRVAAHQNAPGDPESFYAKFIGVGLVSYFHDVTWGYIFKSQILMLMELNRRGGILSLADARVYYDEAVSDYPQMYLNYSFSQWMAFVTSQQLLIHHPSDMLEITLRGKDFLKYLTHCGWYPDARKF